MQACAKALIPQSSPIKQTSPTWVEMRAWQTRRAVVLIETSNFFSLFSSVPIQPLTSRNIVSNGQITTRARRSSSPPSESNSSSSSTSHSENPRKGTFDFPLPTTLDTKKNVIKKSTDIIPPPLINFNNNNTNEDDDDDDTTSSLFSKRNATPAALKHLKNIEDIIRDDGTPRTRTSIQKQSTNGNKDIPIEYDDDSVSQSQISSIDDITVDKASPSPSAHIDFLEDF